MQAASSKKIHTLITCHANADWDAFAAMIGAFLLYPQSVLVFPGSMDRQLNEYFTDTAQKMYPFASAKDLVLSDITTVVVVDTSQKGRVAHIAQFFERPGVAVHVWDHHPAGADPISASELHHATIGSTCALVTKALKNRKVIVPALAATVIGLGIYTDTGSFTYTSTTPDDLEAAAWLLKKGMDLQFVHKMSQQEVTSEHVKLLHDLIESAERHEIGGYQITLAEATMDTFVSDFALVVQRFMEMDHSQAVFALAILDDKTQVVARSQAEGIDVGAVCKALGGGGHRYAAATSVKDIPLPELKSAIFQQLYAQLNPQHTARELMSSPAVGIEDKNSLLDAETLMTRYGFKAVPVFKAGTRQCVGFLEAQTASLAVSHKLGHLPVHIYMQRTPFTVLPETSLQMLMDIIIGSRQRLAPVVENGEVLGVVTRTDLINLFVEDQGRLPLPRDDSSKEKDLSRMLATRLPKHVYALMQKAGNLGDSMNVHVYAVGGFVRDVLLGRPGNELDDIDFVVEGDGLAYARKLAELLDGRIREHQEFLTALIIYKDGEGIEQRIDVATARLEYYLYPAALPTVELSSIKMDLFRRDFTINAMALRVNKEQFGRLVDFFGGQSDIQRKSIRVLHALSFIEDPTRILRAVRFAQRYQFRLSAQTTRLIKNAIDLKLIGKLSGHRLTHEFTNIFKEKDPLPCLDQFQKLGIFAAIHPALAPTQARRELLVRIGLVLDWYKLLFLHEKIDLLLIYFLGITSNMTDADVFAILERLAPPPALDQTFLAARKRIWNCSSRLAQWHKRGGTVSELCALLARLPLEGALYLMAKAGTEEESKPISLYINRWRLVKIDIDGKDLAQMGLNPGPVYGKILAAVLAAKLDGAVETREEQLSLARKLSIEDA